MAEPRRESPKTAPINPITKKGDKGFVADHIDQHRSKDLVFAITGYIGSGMSQVADHLRDLLKQEHSITAVVVKCSDLLAAEAAREGQPTTETPIERTKQLQQFGNGLREKHGSAVIAGLVIRRIKQDRAEHPADERLAFVIDCCKHPAEVEALRNVYGRGFFLVASICDYETRKSWLRTKFGVESKDDEIEQVMDADLAEPDDWGQQVRKTIPLADYFANRNAEASNSLERQLKRLLHLVLGVGVDRPGRDERGMYAAWGAAMRSACLSRQVGAAILNPQGIVIATGTNDVPAPGGGLYPKTEESSGEDARCFLSTDDPDGKKLAERQRSNIWKRVLPVIAPSDGLKPFCRNDETKKAIWEAVSLQLNEILATEGQTKVFTAKKVKDALEGTPIKDLVEFSRALHAEADALLSLARAGGPSCDGASLYVNVFPCHLCTRQIIAAGIKEVVYIEPYPKSMAMILHDDAIADPEQSERLKTDEAGTGKVRFRLFCGVAPRRYVDLFEKHPDIKKDGVLGQGPKRPLDPFFRKSHLDFESSIAAEVDQVVPDPHTKE